MNAGMYGMADGRGMTGRKVAALIGSFDVGQASPCQAIFSSGRGLTTNTGTLSAGVRTKIASISGRGAVRLAAVEMIYQAPSVGTLTSEIWVDGVRLAIATTDRAGSTGSYGATLIGWSTYGSGLSTVAPDFVPFDSSVEIWATRSIAQAVNYSLVVDLHQ